jgi:hypothetical protein
MGIPGEHDVSPKDDQAEEKLPVTAEVGGEGGSYADPTTQVATFEGDVPNAGEPGTDTPAAELDESSPAGQIRKYPTEP